MFVGESGVEYLVAVLAVWVRSRHVPGFRVESVCVCGGRPVRSAWGLVVSISCSVVVCVFSWRVWRGYLACCGWGFVPPSPFFLLLPVLPWVGGAKGGGVGRVFSFFFSLPHSRGGVVGALGCGFTVIMSGSL